MNYHRLKYAPLAFATVFVAATPALAATDALGTTPINSANLTGKNDQVKFSEIALTAFNALLWVATAAAVVYLVLAGFQYITAGGDPEKATKARTVIINAIIGIIVIVAAFFILNAAKQVGGNVTDANLGNL